MYEKETCIPSTDTLVLSGCGLKKDKNSDEKIADTVTKIDVELENQISEALKEESFSWIPNTIEELYAMDIKDFEVLLTENIPDLYEYFVIPEGYVITESDWPSFRDIFSMNIFGKRLYPEDISQDEDVDEIPNTNSEEDGDENFAEDGSESDSNSDEEEPRYGERDAFGNVILPDLDDPEYTTKFAKWYPTEEEIAAYNREELIDFFEKIDDWTRYSWPEGAVQVDYNTLSDAELEEKRAWRISLVDYISIFAY